MKILGPGAFALDTPKIGGFHLRFRRIALAVEYFTYECYIWQVYKHTCSCPINLRIGFLRNPLLIINTVNDVF
jgi:hypothetical protein